MTASRLGFVLFGLSALVLGLALAAVSNSTLGALAIVVGVATGPPLALWYLIPESRNSTVSSWGRSSGWRGRVVVTAAGGLMTVLWLVDYVLATGDAVKVALSFLASTLGSSLLITCLDSRAMEGSARRRK